MMKRVLCVAFSEWPLQRLCAAPPERELREEPRFLQETGVLRERASRMRPLVLFAETSRHGLCVTCCSPAAARRGIVPGMRLAEAEGLSGSGRSSGRLQFVPHDFEADARGLEQLAQWGQRFSPVVGIEPSDSLLLDVTGCGHLFGNEQGLVQQALRELRERLCTAAGLAPDTIGLAWGLSHYGTRWSEIVPEGNRDALRPLPVEALRLSEKVTAALHDLELRRVEQLLALPRSSLPSRFGPEVLQRLDQALGDVPELIVPFRPPEPIEAGWLFPHPTQDRRALETALERLLRQVVERVAVRREGIQRLEVQFHCGAQPAVTVTIGTLRPAVDIPHLMELVLTRLEQTPLSGEVHGVRLRAGGRLAAGPGADGTAAGRSGSTAAPGCAAPGGPLEQSPGERGGRASAAGPGCPARAGLPPRTVARWTTIPGSPAPWQQSPIASHIGNDNHSAQPRQSGPRSTGRARPRRD